MKTTYVPASQMLKKKDFNPLSKWHRLNTNSWIFDFGLIRKWNDETGNGDYYVTDKSHKSGWDLVLYMDDAGRFTFIQYYDFPIDLPEFLHWCYNWVAADEAWKSKSKEGDDQMNFFPYKSLYDGWKKATTQPITESVIGKN